MLGVPNVGKSTVINRLRALGTGRGGRAVRVGDQPGVTRSVSGIIRILSDPEAFLLDTPGVLMPKIRNVDQGMRLAITGAIMDAAVGDHLLVDYLFAFLQATGRRDHLDALKLTSAPSGTLQFIEQVARANGIVDGASGIINTRNTISYILRAFRQGRLGRYTLDRVE